MLTEAPPHMHTQLYCYTCPLPRAGKCFDESAAATTTPCIASPRSPSQGNTYKIGRKKQRWAVRLSRFTNASSPLFLQLNVSGFLSSLEDLRHQCRPHRPSALSDCEPLALLDSQRVHEIAFQFHVVAWHDHLAIPIFGAVGEVETAGFICGSHTHQKSAT